MEEIINLINIELENQEEIIDSLSIGEEYELLVLIDEDSLFPDLELRSLIDNEEEFDSNLEPEDIINIINDNLLSLNYDFNLELSFEDDKYIIKLIK
jgi:hypothetical protein